MAINLDNILGVTNDQKTVLKEAVQEKTVASPKVNIDAILTEWSWRCKKGYPDFNDKSDMYQLQIVLEEMGVNNPFPIVEAEPDGIDPNIPSDLMKFYNALAADKKDLFVKFITDMPKNLLVSFRQGFKNLTNNEITKASASFKSLDTVEDLDNQNYKEYQFIWDIYVGQAIGKGELYISWMVKNGIVQGSTESYDIGDLDKKYEVKSLDVFDNKSGKFKPGNIRPGAEGKVSRYQFTSDLIGFYNVMELLQDPAVRANVLTLGKADSMKKIVGIIDSVRTKKDKSGLSVTLTPGDIPKTMLQEVYAAATELNKIKQLPLNKDVTTSRIAVKGSAIDSQYWISPDDAEDIATNAGKDKDVTIKVGTEVDDESKEGKILLTKLFKHPFVKNVKSFTEGLYKIKMDFFGDKNGLVYFWQGKAFVSQDMSEFATIESSQDGYRFGLKDRYQGYKYIIDQK